MIVSADREVAIEVAKDTGGIRVGTYPESLTHQERDADGAEAGAREEEVTRSEAFSRATVVRTPRPADSLLEPLDSRVPGGTPEIRRF